MNHKLTQLDIKEQYNRNTGPNEKLINETLLNLYIINQYY